MLILLPSSRAPKLQATTSHDTQSRAAKTIGSWCMRPREVASQMRHCQNRINGTIAQDRVGFTELRADAEGTVTARGAEPGEVVQAGQMIVQLARKDGRDAVFDVPAQMIRSLPADPVVEVSLSDAPGVTAVGHVREVAPQADPVTRTFQVKIGLVDPPEAFRLGSTVRGQTRTEMAPHIAVAASALTKSEGRSAVWVVDPNALTVALRPIEAVSFGPASVAVSEGLSPGEIVVTAGVQALHPGQKVRLLEASQ